MAENSVDADSIGPQLNLDGVALPPDIGERLTTLLGDERRYETVAAWVAAIRSALADTEGRTPTVDDLCTSDGGAHTFVADGHTQSYVCVLDPLAYPFLTDTPGTVRSETPVRGDIVEIGIGASEATVSHESAVVSLGASGAIEPGETPTPERIYRQVCGYIHVFADREEYEAWADDADAATTALPVTEGVALAGKLSEELFA
jgi:hypothetical protein